MKTLLKNGWMIDVFTGEKGKSDVLMEDDKILQTGLIDPAQADQQAGRGQAYAVEPQQRA